MVGAGPCARSGSGPRGRPVRQGCPARNAGGCSFRSTSDRPKGAQIGIFFAVFHTKADKRARPGGGWIFATFGGPGRVGRARSVARASPLAVFGPLRERHDVVLIDYRGTGLSQAINCEPLQQGGFDRISRLTRLCGEQLGPESDLYGSEDVAKDIEAVRKALGVGRFDFFGFSIYAGADAQAYAVRYPHRLGRVVLDAPVPLVGYDPWFTDVAGEVGSRRFAERAGARRAAAATTMIPSASWPG